MPTKKVARKSKVLKSEETPVSEIPLDEEKATVPTPEPAVSSSEPLDESFGEQANSYQPRMSPVGKPLRVLP